VLLVEVVGALISGSLALLADAGHMLTDVVGLVIAIIAATLALLPATAKRTWGYRRAEVSGATLQAAALLAVGTYVLIEGVPRFVRTPGDRHDRCARLQRRRSRWPRRSGYSS
jgi:cobalt-zinc-cadmium efflux system protein